jgi:hypothetical protein
MAIPLELMTLLGGGLTGFVGQMLANAQADKQLKFLIKSKQFKLIESSIANARKFTNIFVNMTRRFIVVVILLILVFLSVAGMFVPTNMIVEVPAGSFLGLINWGGGTKIITVEGLVAYPWLSITLNGIIGYYFGQGPAKRA